MLKTHITVCTINKICTQYTKDTLNNEHTKDTLNNERTENMLNNEYTKLGGIFDPFVLILVWNR